jgi:protein TonB
MPRKPETREGTVKVSGGPMLNSATKKVEPDYPPIARAAGAGGKVRVNITISDIIDAEIIEGHPLLRDSVLQAVKQWEFKPTELSGLPVKVVGVLTFNFTLK